MDTVTILTELNQMLLDHTNYGFNAFESYDGDDDNNQMDDYNEASIAVDRVHYI
jgi:hypothetical protein